jgi:hypothetical protein
LNKNNNQLAPGIFLPRTGIEQPFMRDRPRFKETHKEFEPTHTMNVRKINCLLVLEFLERGICEIGQRKNDELKLQFKLNRI